MADPITTSTAIAQGSGATATPTLTSDGATRPNTGVPSPSRGSLAVLDQEIEELRRQKTNATNQISALREQRKALVERAQYLAQAQFRGDPNDPNSGYVGPDGQTVSATEVVNARNIPQQIADIDTQISSLLQRAAAVQQDIVQAAQQRDAIVRQVATDEDPRTLEALTRAAQKEQLQLDKDQSDLEKQQADANWEAAYRTGFSGADKAALDKAKADAEAKSNAATAALNAANAAGIDLDNQAKAISLKYADRTGAAGVVKAEGEATSATEAGKQAAIKTAADRQALDAGIGTWTVEQLKQSAASQQALAGKYGAETAQTQLTTEQARQGEAVTRINQLREAIRKGALTKEAAGDLYFNAVYGGDQFQRSAQASKNALELQRDLLTAGLAVRGDQQYVVGGEPGGAYQQGLAQLGLSYTPTPLRPTSLPAWAQASAVDISPRQGLPAGQPFTDAGDFNPAFQSPLGTPAWAQAPVVATAPATAQAAAPAWAQGGQPAVRDLRGGAFRAQFGAA